MLKRDIIDGKEYDSIHGALIADLDHTIQTMLQISYPDSQMDDFITYKNLSQYCMDYLSQIIDRANEKNEAIKQQVTAVLPMTEAPFNVEDRLTASYTFGQRAADYDRLQARNDFNVNMESEREIRLLHTKIDHMVQQDQTDLLEIQKLQTELLVSLSNQVIQLRQEMNQERMEEVEKM